MDKQTKKQIARDCAGFMRASALMRVVYELLLIASPTLSAFLIGDMVDYLLAGNTEMILERLPFFILAILFISVVVPLARLVENLLLTKDGFAYDSFLAERFIRMPLIDAQQLDVGAVIERFEEDSAAYCFCRVYRICRPPVLVIYLAVLSYILVVRQINGVFIAAIMLLSVLPIIWANVSSETKARLDREALDYDDSRKSVEHDMFNARDFIRNYKLTSYMESIFRSLFKNFIVTTGKKRTKLTALSSTLEYAFSYGSQILTVLLGSILISCGNLTAGELFGGVLLLPTIAKFYELISEFLFELKHEKECLSRIALFYSNEPEKCSEADSTPNVIELKNIGFKYPAADFYTISEADFRFNTSEKYMIKGANGSGKTTLLNIISGLYAPNQGRITDGEDAALSFGTLRQAFAVQEQNGAIFSGTVFDNLFISEQQRQQAQELLDEFGFEKHLDYDISESGSNLSPGEQKKLLLTRTLLRDAPMLILDEPLNHLDPHGIAALSRILKQRDGGLILVSHKGISNDIAIRVENIYTLGD